MRKLTLTLTLSALLVAGCSSAPTIPTAADLEGLSPAEVTEALGTTGNELPNISGDTRQLIIFEIEGEQYAAAFIDGSCQGFKAMP